MNIHSRPMRRIFSSLISTLAGLALLPSALYAHPTTTTAPKTTYVNEPFPQSGVKSSYSPLAIPTKLERINQPLSALLNKNYHISNISPYPQGLLLLLSTLHTPPEHPQQIICILNPPMAGTDQNVPTSRCWLLN